MLNSIQEISKKIDNPIVWFSTGRDSIVMLHLFMRHYNKPFKVVFLYTFQGLDIHEDIIQYYENLYNIEILREPAEDYFILFRNKFLSRGDLMRIHREQFDSKYISLGYRQSESLGRLAQLGMVKKTHGIDYRNGCLYPLIKFSPKLIDRYLKEYKLKLPITYRHGFRDIHLMKGDSLLWVYNNMPSDYNKIKKQYPKIEIELTRALMKHGQV